MGFWSGLGKALTIGAGAVAAPFTGGMSLAATLPAILGGAGSVIGAMGGAATQNRGSEANFAQQAMRDHENALINREVLKLRQAEDSRTTEEDNFRKALVSALGMNMQDAKFSREGFRSPVANISFSGGARPSALGTQGREAASLLNNQALQRLMAGPPERTELPALERAEMPKASIWERLAGPVGLGLSVAGAGLDARNLPQPAPPPQGAMVNPQLFRNIDFGE